MHAVIPILPSTHAQAERLLERIADLGGVSQFPAVLVSGGEIDLAKAHKLAASAFQSVSVLPVDVPEGHPTPANVLFTRSAWHMAEKGDSYLYLEPDSWPTNTNWLKDLVSVYREHGFRFMGKLAQMPDESGEAYMLATAFYPKDFYLTSDLIRQVPANRPVDQFLQGEVVYRGKAHDSGLFVVGNQDERNAALVIHYFDADDLDDGGRAPHETGYTKPSGVLNPPLGAEKRLQGVDLDAPENLSPDTVVGAYAATMAESYPDGVPASVPYHEGTVAKLVDLPTGTVPARNPDLENALTRIVSDRPIEFRGQVDYVTRQSLHRALETTPTHPSPEVYEADAKLSSDTIKLNTDWTHNPSALDPSIKTHDVAASGIPLAMQHPGTLDPYPQPNVVVNETTAPALTEPSAEGFATEEQRNAAIKRAQSDKMPWRDMLRTFGMTPKALKEVLNAV